jgi:hypothetical protein
MSVAAVRVGVGTRFQYDGEVVVVEELFGAASGVEVLVRDGRGDPTTGQLITLARDQQQRLPARARKRPGTMAPAAPPTPRSASWPPAPYWPARTFARRPTRCSH